ncbi:uncharacterized protein LOC124337021 [Daphnia pulicaria]|uniref:uncharacterized protein LOC124337021 n=1 Tax=Daphnia pulicaria TaxID=35523 RepID=UPI001EE9C99E|nr:uncharacterized protein LOC124337021 [Daphnia pulicaria]
MHDENGNQYPEGSFVVPTSIFPTSGRSLKRSKSISKPRSPCIDLSPAPSPEEINSNHESSLPICLRRSSQLIGLTPCGCFEQLPTELIYYLLQFLPLTSIGKLSQTSKDMRNILIRWIGSSRMQSRLMDTILLTPFTSTEKAWSGRLSLPYGLHRECKCTGILIKQLTCLFPTSQRLGLYHQLITEAKQSILQQRPDFEQHLIAAASGIILHSMISGWDKGECIKVHATICYWNNITFLLSEYLNNPVSTNVNIERTLRLYMRSLFLDFCAYSDRLIWIEIIFDCSQLSQHLHLARLLLLLYTPLQTGGSVMWDFFEGDVDCSSYTEEYKMLGETLAYIIASPQRCCATNEAVDIIQTITRMPTHWSNRSLAALLLCIHCVDNKPVISYFKHLSSDAEMGLAIEVLGNIFFMASEFISSNQTDNVGFHYRSVFNLIRNAINCGWGTDERRTMVQELWSDIREMCSTLLDDAVMIGNAKDLHSLMETWKEICIHLTF